MSKIDSSAQAQTLARKLWEIANELRGTMDASKFKNYILGTIFYRYLSEHTERYLNEQLVNDELTYEEAFPCDDYHDELITCSLSELGYVIKPVHLFRTLVQKIQAPVGEDDRFSIEDYEKAIKALTESTQGRDSESTFAGLFDDMRLQDKELGRTVAERTSHISSVITKINELDFDLTDIDLLGTAYMQLIGLFASDAGKKAGEFFTPTCLAKLVATLATIGLSEAKSVGDCTCGSASMLLEVQKHLSAHKVGHFYGQEKNASNCNLARMNMLMHGVSYRDFTIYNGDTLTEDHYDDLKLTVQVCNPPYSLNYEKTPNLKSDPRYKDAGKLPRKNQADFLFLEHMIYHMDSHDGRIAVLLPPGVLSRDEPDQTIRKYIIQKLNCLDAVISLPKNLFHGTDISVCLLVLKADRGENKDNILLIHADTEFSPGVNQNTLAQEHIDKIVDSYIKRVDVDHFARVVPLKEIEANDFNLNISRYIHISEAKQEIDLEATRAELNSIASDKQEAIGKIDAILAQLGL